MSKARAKKIKLILFDVDGVLTDGKIWIFPAPAGARQATQHQARFRHRSLRARDLKLEHVHLGIEDQLTCFEGILQRENLKPSEAAFVGDDIIDLPVMRKCGRAIAVANARQDVKREAHMVTEHAGGDGAARDAVEFILKAQGKWKGVIGVYIGERSPRKS